MVTKLAAFRQQYPQYNGVSDAQLANALHAKFYSKIPFDQFASKVGLKTDPVTGAVDTLERSIPFADEASAGVSALAGRVFGGAPSLSSAWANARAQQKAQADAFQAAHPYLSGAATGAGIGGQVVGAISSGGASELPAVEGLLPNVVRGAKGLLGIGDAGAPTTAKGLLGAGLNTGKNAVTGGTLAAINAFANTDGDLQARTDAAKRAAPIGAVIGGAAPPVVGAVGKGMQEFANKGATATQKAAMKAAQILKNRAPDAVTLDPASVPDGQFPFQQMGGGGKSLARAVAATPGPGQDIAQAQIATRSGQAGPRVMVAVQDATGASRGDYYPTKDMQTAARKAVADPLYAQSAATPVNEVDFQRLMGPILNTDIGQRAMTSAQRIAEAESVVTGQPSTWDQNIINNGQVVNAQTPGAPMLDKMAQGWDEALRPYYQGGRLSTEGRAMLGLRNEFVNRLGQLVPANAQARAAWSQGSDILDAMQTGRDIVRKQTDPELVEQSTADMTPEQLQAQQTGMAYELTGKAQGDNPQAFYRQLTNNQTMQQRLRAGFALGDDGDTAFNAFMDSIKQEADQQATHNNVLAGSRTTPLKADVDAANEAGTDEPDASDSAIAGINAVNATRKFLKAPISGSLALGLKGLSKVQNFPLTNPDVSRHLGEVLFGLKSPEDLFGAAAQGTSSSGYDMNTMLKTISAINRGAAGGLSTGQDQPPSDQSWINPGV
jgi:hypothetical protein